MDVRFARGIEPVQVHVGGYGVLVPENPLIRASAKNPVDIDIGIHAELLLEEHEG